MRFLRLLAAIALCAASGSQASAQDFEALSVELLSGDRESRREAALQLQEIGADALPALQALIEALGDDDEQVAARSVMAVASMGPAAEAAIPALIQSMDTQRRRYDEQVVFRSAFALGQIGVPAVGALREALKSPVEGQRSGAAQALQMIGTPAAAAIPELVTALHDDESEVRRPAADALAAMGVEALGALQNDLRDSPGSAAVRAIGLIGPPAREAAPELIGLIGKSRDNKPMYAALVEASGSVEPPFELLEPLLREALTDDAEVVRRAAASVLLSYPEAEEHSLPVLQDWLGDEEDPNLRSQAAWTIGQFGGDASFLAPDLIQRLDQGDELATVTRALAGIGPASTGAILEAVRTIPLDELMGDEDHWAPATLKKSGALALPALERGLESEHASVRFVALDALAELGKIARPLEPKFRKASNDPVAGVRLAALVVLESVGADPQRLATILRRRSGDDSAAVRAIAVRLLGKSREGHRQAYELVDRALGDEDPAVRLAAVAALEEFGSEAEASMPKLVMLAKGADGASRLVILRTLAAVGGGASEALPMVRESLDDSDPQVRGAAISALVAIEPGGESLTEVLSKMLADDDPAVRHPAIEGLGQRGEDARSAAPLLFELLEREEDRAEALDALRRIRSLDPDLYISALDNREPRVRLFACEALGRLGKKAEKALPQLEHLTKDRYDFVRRRASDAIKRIRG
ncbi:MAG: HEAT repeat domain-containing protein [Verrucomicrobiales bacterium]